MSCLNSYKHLNECTPLKVIYPMEQLVKDICDLNYGSHRLLSALVDELRERARKQDAKFTAKWPDHKAEGSPLADGIEVLLNKGFYS